MVTTCAGCYVHSSLDLQLTKCVTVLVSPLFVPRSYFQGQFRLACFACGHPSGWDDIPVSPCVQFTLVYLGFPVLLLAWCWYYPLYLQVKLVVLKVFQRAFDEPKATQIHAWFEVNGDVSFFVTTLPLLTIQQSCTHKAAPPAYRLLCRSSLRASPFSSLHLEWLSGLVGAGLNTSLSSTISSQPATEILKP